MSLVPSLRPKYDGDKQIQTAAVGDNDIQLPDILNLYALAGQTIFDVTWGKGAMWKKVEAGKYRVRASDLRKPDTLPDWVRWGGCNDFTRLPCRATVCDVLLLDPPYMAGKQTHESLAEAYANNNDSHDAVIRLYMGGFLEAWRVLRLGGRIIVKCQDEMSGGFQQFSHCELLDILKMMGFEILDLFVLVNETTKLMSCHEFQRTARKNHSYWIVAMKPFARPTKRSGSEKKRKLRFKLGS